MKINEDNLAPVIIDLNIKSKGEVTESFLSILGHGIKTILRRMFWEDYGIPSNVKVRGTSSQLSAFRNAITREKKYLDAISDYGLNDPKTYRSRAMLDSAVNKFERKTGLKWPFE
tara:strand:- start:287 stop:631 length:345 start_codon:yes stop_codon:yes gene_type:complete